MATQQTGPKKTSKWDEIVQWYANHAYLVGIIYSAGAAVVIIGALFKILHWPGASYVLMAGMFTEAFLFIMGVLEKPHATYHWENVFPQLIGNEPKEITLDGGIAGGDKNIQTKAPQVPSITEEQVKALQDGIENVANAASKLATIGEVATATNGLIDKMNAAGEAAQSFAGTQDALLVATGNLAKQYQALNSEVEKIQANTQAHNKGIETINVQLSALNSVYELQLKEIQAQSATYKAQTEKLNGVSANVATLIAQTEELKQTATTSVEASKQYLAAQQKLAAQVADLNKVYGNMLSAL